MTDKPVIENTDPTVPSDDGTIQEDICQHERVRYSMLYKSVVCDDCKRTWRDEWGPIELKPVLQIQMQLPQDIELLIRSMHSRLGGNGLYS